MSEKNIRVDDLQKAEMKSNVELSLFDINAQIISQLPIHTSEQYPIDIEIVNNFDKKKKSDYYMLLCKELSYYTLFTTEGTPDPESIGEIVLECVANLGSIHSFDNIDNNEVEIWISNDNEEMFCLHFFDYTEGVVHFKR